VDPDGHVAMFVQAVQGMADMKAAANWLRQKTSGSAGAGLSLQQHFGVQVAARALELPADTAIGLTNLATPGGFATLQGKKATDTGFAPIRQQQVRAVQTAMDNKVSLGERAAHAALAMATVPVTIIEGLTYAAGGRASDRMGKHLNEVMTQPTLEGKAYAALETGGDFIEAFGSFGTLATPLASAAAPGQRALAAARAEADVAQRTFSGSANRPATAAGLELSGGRVRTGLSTKGAPHPDLEPSIQTDLAAIKEQLGTATPRHHGCCAELPPVSDAVRAGENLPGATMAAVRIRAAGNPAHGTPITFCPSCQILMEKLGIRPLPPAGMDRAAAAGNTAATAMRKSDEQE
jgi:hypothetical protein